MYFSYLLYFIFSISYSTATQYVSACVFSAAVVPPNASAVKSYSNYSQPGQLFSVQPKVETSTSICAATTNQTWKIMESLTLGSQPKATPVPSFTSQAPTSSSSITTCTANQDYSTVNLSDLHEFFPNISSGMAQESASSQTSTVSSQPSNSFAIHASPFKVDAPLGEDDIPDFPSFSEAQAPGTLDSLNMDDFVDLLNPPPIVLAQQPAPSSFSTAAHNSTVSQNTDPAGNPGSTWMNYPNSIVNLLQNEGMIDITSNNNNHRPPVLDEFDELMSADEDRLISIFNSESQAGFVSGHPT